MAIKNSAPRATILKLVNRIFDLPLRLLVCFNGSKMKIAIFTIVHCTNFMLNVQFQ